MPEPNGEIPRTGDARVDAAIERIRGKFRDMEDAMIVQAYLNRDTARLVKEMAERHDRYEGEHEQQHEREVAEQKAKDAALNERIDKLVSAIGDLIRRIPPANLR